MSVANEKFEEVVDEFDTRLLDSAEDLCDLSQQVDKINEVIDIMK